jgi:hypothetical protein
MDQKQKNSFGMGAMVGVSFFWMYYSGWFGISTPTNLVGSMGIGFGYGFSASVQLHDVTR